MGRPPKPASDRKTAAMQIPMTDAEKKQIEAAAEVDEAKPVTWAQGSAPKGREASRQIKRKARVSNPSV